MVLIIMFSKTSEIYVKACNSLFVYVFLIYFTLIHFSILQSNLSSRLQPLPAYTLLLLL